MAFVSTSKKIVVFQLVLFCLIGIFLLTTLRTYRKRQVTELDLPLQQQFRHDQPRRPYTIITGTSANHLCALENFLYSLSNLKPDIPHHQYPRVAVYNIGMNRSQLPILDQFVQNGLVDEIITFDHERYPRFWDVAIKAGEYGWKTGIVNDARVRYGGVLVWLDAGNQVTKDFVIQIPNIVRYEYNGFWSPRSQYGMGKMTHPAMFKFFGADPKEYKYKPNCNGAAIGFDTDNTSVVNNLLIPWFECGLQKNCIAPPGSSRANHRQDQAALTYLAYANGHSCLLAPREFNSLQTHRDVACRSNLIELDLQNKLHHPSAIDYPKWERNGTVELYYHPEWKYKSDQVPKNLRKPIEPL